MSIVVFGSINMDLVVRSPRLPQPGETIIGYDFMTIPGGKGANQAVAAAKLGVSTQMVGRVGADDFGQTLVETLRGYGVGCDRLTVDPHSPSGIALIEVDAAGNNHIIVVPGANGQVGADELEALTALLASAQILLLQLELPLGAVVTAAELAHQHGVRVILDPAPVQSLPTTLYPLIDILTPNRTEAEQLTGRTIECVEDAIATAQILHQWGVKIAIVTLGEEGVVVVSDRLVQHFPAFTVEVVDTVAAGDAFNGGLAGGLLQNLSLEQAIIWGMATAALAVTQPGAQPAIPNAQTLLTFLSQNYKDKIN
ncbi:MAG: ribokinase [Leptolyngbyaceae bacterium]|nr:ribokinase [Leptolyngbyaceae bacterium]